MYTNPEKLIDYKIRYRAKSILISVACAHLCLAVAEN